MDSDLVEGGLYSHEDGTGHYSVAKVLVVEPSVVHLRLYKNRFTIRPTFIDPTTLDLGTFFDHDEDFGIGHIPLARDNFAQWQPVLIMQTPVTDEELAGYRMWKEAGGGVWGAP